MSVEENIIKKRCCFCLMILSVLFAFAIGAQATEAAGLKILTEESPPLNFIEDGEITGLATEVVQELSKRTGTDGNIRPGATVRELLASSRLAIAISDPFNE